MACLIVSFLGVTQVFTTFRSENRTVQRTWTVVRPLSVVIFKDGVAISAMGLRS